MLAEVIKLLRKAEGRDKITKFIVYLLKLVDALKSLRRHSNTFRYERVASHLQKARQINRVGKFITEYANILLMIREDSKDEFGRMMLIVVHTFFSFYWIFDNLALFSSFGLVDVPEFQIAQICSTLKLFGLFFAAFLNLRTWLRLHHQQIRERIGLRSARGADSIAKNQKLMLLIQQQWKMMLLCLKIFAEMLPSIAKSALDRKLLKAGIPRTVQAIGGLVNAFVACLLASM